MRFQQITSRVFEEGEEGKALKEYLHDCRKVIVRLLPLPVDALRCPGAVAYRLAAPVRLVYQYDIWNDRWIGRFDCWAEVHG